MRRFSINSHKYFSKRPSYLSRRTVSSSWKKVSTMDRGMAGTQVSSASLGRNFHDQKRPGSMGRSNFSISASLRAIVTANLVLLLSIVQRTLNWSND